MHKLLASTYKEFLLLTRDIGGLAILLWVNQDQGEIAETIYQGFVESNTLELLEKNSETEAKELVFKGAYKLAIIIPKNLSVDLEKKVQQNVNGIMAKFDLEEDKPSSTQSLVEQKEVRLYFDPATQYAFKSAKYLQSLSRTANR